MPGTCLGFDYGRKRIGVAVGEFEPLTSFGLTTLHSAGAQPDWAAIEALVQEWQPVALVVGLPVHMDGTEHELTRAARAFATELGRRFELPVHLADERLSSRAAHEIHTEQRRAGKRRHTADTDEDRIAAGLILEHWLQNVERDH